MEQKVGITCDNYKVEKFKAELEKAGFNNFDVVPDKNTDITAIIVKCDHTEFFSLGVICQDVEEYFRAIKN